MIIYIAGKISGDPNYKQKFNKAQKRLESQGYTVLNPAVLPQGLTAQDYMMLSFQQINAADRVLFLPDYTDSPGALLELQYCKYIRKRILFGG